jgi:lipoprotein-releasing system permease protein
LIKDKQINLKVAGFIAKRIAFSAKARGSSGEQEKSGQSFSRFIIRLSTAATIISVAVMIITLAFANGFQETVTQKIFSFWGHIRVQEKQPDKAIISEESPIVSNPVLVKQIEAHREVESIHAFATRYAMIKTKEDIEGVLVKGFDSSYNFKYLKPFIKEGRPLQFSDSSYSREILLSSTTASRMQLKAGDSIIMYFIKTGENPRPRKVLIAGLYKTGIEEYDKLFAIGDIRLIRRLNNWNENEVGGYEIFLKDYTRIEPMTKELYELDEFPDTWDTISARNISPNIFDWLKLQDKNRLVLIGIMLIVAVINLITCLIILVLERIKMVGILKALGASDWTVQKIFLWHSAIITAKGILFGLLLGLGILWLQQSTGFIKLPEDAYYMDTAAVKLVWWQIGVVCAGTLLVCFLVLMIPTFIVKRVQPVRAIQFR